MTLVSIRLQVILRPCDNYQQRQSKGYLRRQ